jgi:hypothetical protein
MRRNFWRRLQGEDLGADSVSVATSALPDLKMTRLAGSTQSPRPLMRAQNRMARRMASGLGLA